MSAKLKCQAAFKDKNGADLLPKWSAHAAASMAGNAIRAKRACPSSSPPMCITGLHATNNNVSPLPQHSSHRQGKGCRATMLTSMTCHGNGRLPAALIQAGVVVRGGEEVGSQEHERSRVCSRQRRTKQRGRAVRHDHQIAASACTCQRAWNTRLAWDVSPEQRCRAV